jgi:hypothetical protein
MLRSTLRQLARGLSRRPSPARKAAAARPRQPSLEELESRLVPTVSVSVLGGVLTAQCDGGANTVTVDHVIVSGKGFAEINGKFFSDASYNSIRVNGGAGGTVTDIHGTVKPLTVFGDSAKDVVNLGSVSNKVQGIQGNVLLEDEKGFTATLNINDQGDVAPRTVALSTVPRPKDSALGEVLGLGAAAIEWDYHDTAAVNLNLGTGASTVSVNGTGPLTTNISVTAPNATVNVGNGDVVANILGKLNLETQAAGATVNISDLKDGTKETATLDTVSRSHQSSLGQLSGLGSAVITWDYLGTSGVNIFGGTGHDTFNVHATVVPAVVETDASAFINVGHNGSIAGIQGKLTLQSKVDGSNTVDIFSNLDSSKTTAKVDSDPFTDRGFLVVPGLAAAIRWDNSDTSDVTLNLGSGTVNVFSINEPTNVFTNGNATINVGDGIFGLAGLITSPLHLATFNGSDVVNIFDQGDTGARSVTLDSLGANVGRITGLSAPITYRSDEVKHLSLNLGPATQVDNILATGLAPTDVINSSNASVFVGSDSAGNGGTLAGIESFLFLLNTNGKDFVSIANFNDDVSETFDLHSFASNGTTFDQIFGSALKGSIAWDDAHTSDMIFFGGIGRDTYNIASTGVPTTIVNGASATFNLGDGNNDISGIKGALSLAGQGQGISDTINVFDQGNDTSTSVALDTLAGNVGQITGLSAPITFNNAETSHLELDLGIAISTVNVNAVGITAPNGTIITNSGNATVFVGTGTLSAIQGFVGLNNTNGSDTVIIDDSEDSTGQTFGLFTFAGTAPEGAATLTQVFGTWGSANEGFITWDNATTSSVTLIGGSLGNVFNVFSTGATPITIDGGSGANAFNVLAPGTTGSLVGNILGSLTLHGGGNAGTQLNLNDQPDPGSETFIFTIPQAGTGTLNLGSNPLFNLSFDGMNGGVNLATNGFSTVDAPPGTVNIVS